MFKLTFDAFASKLVLIKDFLGCVNKKVFVCHPVCYVLLRLALDRTPWWVALLEDNHQTVGFVSVVVPRNSQVWRIFRTLKLWSIYLCIDSCRICQHEIASRRVSQAIYKSSIVARLRFYVFKVTEVLWPSRVKALPDKPKAPNGQISDIVRAAIKTSHSSGHHESIFIAKIFIDWKVVLDLVHPDDIVLVDSQIDHP